MQLQSSQTLCQYCKCNVIGIECISIVTTDKITCTYFVSWALFLKSAKLQIWILTCRQKCKICNSFYILQTKQYVEKGSIIYLRNYSIYG